MGERGEVRHFLEGKRKSKAPNWSNSWWKKEEVKKIYPYALHVEATNITRTCGKKSRRNKIRAISPRRHAHAYCARTHAPMLAVFFCLENKSLCFFFLSGKRSKWAALCTSLTWKQPHPRPRKHHKQSPLQLLLPSPQVPKRSKKTKREVTHARLSQFTSQPTRKHHKPPPTLAAAARKCRRGKRKQRERVIQTHTLFVTIYISNAIPASAAATRARLKGGSKNATHTPGRLRRLFVSDKKQALPFFP